MLLKSKELKELAENKRGVFDRSWKKLRIKVGSRFLSPIGLLEVSQIDEIGPSSQSSELRDFKITLKWAGEDPRLVLREKSELDDEEFQEILTKLEGFDKRSKSGPWAFKTLELIQENPGKRASDLADTLGLEKLKFKPLVRKMKAYGLTISLEVGYKLSPRGEAFLKMHHQNLRSSN